MKKIRRLDAGAAQNAYQKAQRGLLRFVMLSEEAFRALEKERPDHVIVEGEAVLAGEPFRQSIRLHYAFPNRDAFAREFPDMFQRLAAVADQEEAPLGFRLMLTDRSGRPYLEPVLFAQAFELTREWMQMILHELPDAGPPTDEIAPGFALRPAHPDDAGAISELDAVAFPKPAITPEIARTLVSETPVFRVLEESSSGRAVGFLRLRIDDRSTGHISDIALHPDVQRRGLGEAAMRWALAWFRAEGLRRATLTVSTDNSPAIALYRKLGFVPSEVGLDYRRPIDEDEVRRVLEKHRAVHIKVRSRV